jgi:hypothetical protein
VCLVCAPSTSHWAVHTICALLCGLLMHLCGTCPAPTPILMWLAGRHRFALPMQLMYPPRCASDALVASSQAQQA